MDYSSIVFCCIFSVFWFIPLELITGKKSLDRKYVLLRQAGVKQNKSVVKYPLWEENIIFHCFKDIWLIIT